MGTVYYRMTQSLLALLFLFVYATPVHAQERDTLFRVGVIAHALAQTSDGITTWKALQRNGVYEANPIQRWTVQSPYRIGAVKLAATTLSTWAFTELHKTHRTTARIAVWTLTAGIGSVAIHNSRQGRR